MSGSNLVCRPGGHSQTTDATQNRALPLSMWDFRHDFSLEQAANTVPGEENSSGCTREDV
jgi:hypothetical protein